MNLGQSLATQTMPQVASFRAASAMGFGDLVYVSGYNASDNAFIATKADADASGRPAQWVCLENIASGSVGQFAAMDQNIVGILDTSGGVVGDPVYLSATAGLMTLTAPTGSSRIQIVGFITVSSATVGAVQLLPQGSQNTTQALPAFAGPLTITSSSASALAVGLAGATNPSFVVDSSTASQAAGLKITGAIAAGTVAVAVISSGADANLTVNAKGTGTIGIGSASTGRVTITPVTTITGLVTLTAGITGTLAVAGGITGTTTLTLGVAAGTTGAVLMTGTTSGVVTLSAQDAAGTWTMKLPAAVGMAGQQLTDVAGDGVTAWAAASFGAWKNDLGILDPREALARVVKSPTHIFTYKPEVMPAGQASYDGTRFTGIFAEEARWAMHGLDDGKSGAFSPVNAVGYLRAAVEALYNELQELKGQRQAVA